MKKIFLFIAAFLFTVSIAVAEEKGKPHSYKVGKYEVYVLTENSGMAANSILIDAPEDVLQKYAPEGGSPNAVNAVLVRSKDEVWLVDTGFGRHIFEKMAALGIEPEEVDHVLLTHMHGDHIGGMFRDGKPAFPNADVVVAQKEYDYWSSTEQMNKFPENRRGSFVAAQKLFSEYAGRLKIVQPLQIKDRMPAGITPVAAYGHTPGHIMFMVRDGKKQLLIWGDLTHAMAVQMPHPEISVTYDVDPDMARESRIAVLRHIAGKDILVVGMHIDADYPGRVYPGKVYNNYSFEVLARLK